MLKEIDVIDRMLAPVAAAFVGDAARRLADARFDAEVVQHLSDLAALANEGRLTPDQRVDYDFLLAISDVISLLKAKVRTTSITSAAVPVA